MVEVCYPWHVVITHGFLTYLQDVNDCKTVSTGLMQSCPSYEVGSTSTDMIQRSEPDQEGHVHLNLDDGAMCSGTIYGWRYCFDPDDDQDTELILAMYRPQQNGTYQLVPGSYYELRTSGDFSSFTCKNITLTPSEYFTVKQNDVVAFCEGLNTQRVELFFEQPGSSLWYWDAGGCSESIIRTSDTISQINNRIFLLKALIGEFRSNP